MYEDDYDRMEHIKDLLYDKVYSELPDHIKESLVSLILGEEEEVPDLDSRFKFSCNCAICNPRQIYKLNPGKTVVVAPVKKLKRTHDEFDCPCPECSPYGSCSDSDEDSDEDSEGPGYDNEDFLRYKFNN